MAVERQPLRAKPADALAATAGRQRGLITRPQALAVGVTPAMFKTLLRRGHLIRVLPGVYRLSGSPRSWMQDILALVLWGGDEAVISHATAAKLWRFPITPTELHLTLPTRRVAPRPGVRIHRGRTTARESLDGIPVTNAARTLLDIAGHVDPDALEAMVDEAINRKLTTIAGLEWELAMTGGPGRTGSTALRNAMSHLSDGHCESYLENKVLRVLLEAGLPMPVRQHEIRAGSFTARVDLAYPAAKLAIEVDGYRHHGSRLAFDQDRRRDNRLHALGWQVVRVTDRLLRDPADFVEAVRTSLEDRLF